MTSIRFLLVAAALLATAAHGLPAKKNEEAELGEAIKPPALTTNFQGPFYHLAGTFNWLY